MVHAGVEEDVVEESLSRRRLLQLLGEAAKSAPMVGHRAAAVRNNEAQLRKAAEDVTRQALHEGSGIGIQVMCAGGVKAGIAAGADMHHGWDVVLDHPLIDRKPVRIR